MRGTVVDDSPTSLPQLYCTAMRNRIGISADLVAPPTSEQAAKTSCAIHHEHGFVEHHTIQHQVCLFGPERYEPRYEYPLFVWLHSCHSSERELEGVMPALSLQNYVGCAPRGPLSSDRGRNRFGWGRTSNATAVAEEIIFESVENAKRHFAINPKRVFLAGFGSGASMALRVGLRYPDSFSGVVAVCGEFPKEQCVLANLPQARSLPLLWMYGEHSQKCGIRQVCDSLPILHTAGLSVDIRQYPCGDDLLSNMLSDANGWMMQLVTNQSCPDTKMSSETFSAN
jgi:phospholipase/carboxylesterase